MSSISATGKQQYFSSLKREHKEAIGLLSIGTFLEYFDLMLYVHLAVLLNELFFPKTDPYTEQLFVALAFCSTYFMRPFGALFFGWLGDNIGRKATVIITTTIMAVSCLVMANLPTYAQIGITATWVVTICRILQGMASMGEIIGAILYLTEMTKPPVQYPVAGFMSICSVLGTSAALGVAALVTSNGFDWRLAFWIGALIALVGTVARTTLRETPVFADAKKRIQVTFEKVDHDKSAIESIPYKEKASFLTAASLFVIQCGYPMCFYLAYIHCGNLLKQQFGFTAAQVIQQNFIISIISFVIMIVIAFLSYKVNPLKILKVRASGFLIFAISSPYLFEYATSSLDIMMIQCYIMLFFLADFPAVPVFFKNFPVFKRFTYSSMIYALTRSVMSAVTSFGLVFLVHHLGNYGALALMLPVLLGFWLGVLHFEKLEKVRVANQIF
jgi:MFS family permease